MRNPDRAAAERLTRLAAICAARKDADLAQLASLTLRLSRAEAARADMDQALRAEVNAAMISARLDDFRALDAHIVVAEQMQSVVDREISVAKALWTSQRDRCIQSFGRAAVLDQISRIYCRQ
ncbi:MAG: hypothetical protein WAT77_16960 [Paracoccaceae bacterium]|jgi:hypothetical protein